MKPNILKAITLLFLLVLAHSVTLAQPVITSPPPGATNTSSAMTIQWTSGAGVSEYYLSIGSVVNGTNIYSRNMGLNLSTTVTNLPTNGMTLYIQLSWLTSSGWQSYNQTNTALGVATPYPMLTSPDPGSTLTNSSATFQWTSGTDIFEYYLTIGSGVGLSDIFGQNEHFNLSATVTNLPVNGMTLYVRLSWLSAAGWQFQDQTNTAFGVATPYPTMVSPAPGAALSSSSATFQWTGGTGVYQYYLGIGSSAGATDIYYKSQNLNVSTTVTGLPTNGMTLYVRLYWLVAAGWQSGDSTNYAAISLGAQGQSGNFIISWPTNNPAYWLEYATNLPASGWFSNPISPAILNGRYTVTNGTPNPFKIYRLTK